MADRIWYTYPAKVMQTCINRWKDVITTNHKKSILCDTSSISLLFNKNQWRKDRDIIILHVYNAIRPVFILIYYLLIFVGQVLQKCSTIGKLNTTKHRQNILSDVLFYELTISCKSIARAWGNYYNSYGQCNQACDIQLLYYYIFILPYKIFTL